jgi:hypothetical protein
MPNEQINLGEEIMVWTVPEYEKHERSSAWYIVAGVMAIALLIYCFFTANFLFAVIIIVTALVVILHDGRHPEMVKFGITTEGIVIGRKFYDYDEIQDFSIIYKPRLEVKRLYFEFKNALKHRLSIYLGDINPLIVRENLLKYLKEDLERTDQPLSEGLARIFKL